MVDTKPSNLSSICSRETAKYIVKIVREGSREAYGGRKEGILCDGKEHGPGVRRKGVKRRQRSVTD